MGQHGLERKRRGEGADHRHVAEPVARRVERADDRGGELANSLGAAAGIVGERMPLAVRELLHGEPFSVHGQLGGGNHLVVDRPLLVECERPIGLLHHAEVADLAPDLFVAIVGMQKRIDVRMEEAPERLGAGRCGEVVDGSVLGGERALFCKRRVLDVPEPAPFVPLPEEQVLLRVRRAPVVLRIGSHVEHRLRRRLESPGSRRRSPSARARSALPADGPRRPRRPRG